MACPFCDKVANRDQLTAEEHVWTFPHSVALLGPWQFYAGYCVLIARQHATELSQLSDSARQGYLNEMCLLARAIEAVTHPHKLNYELLGNQVPHLHWHLFPRSADDPDRLRPVWFALERADQDPAERQRLQGRVARLDLSAQLRRQLQTLNAATS